MSGTWMHWIVALHPWAQTVCDPLVQDIPGDANAEYLRCLLGQLGPLVCLLVKSCAWEPEPGWGLVSAGVASA